MNFVANIAGTYGCFISHWTAQAQTFLAIMPLALRERTVDYYTVSNRDVMQVVTKENDLAYLDSPYTKRQYASYYHIIEIFIRGDDPVGESVAGLRPWEDKTSVFCYKTTTIPCLWDGIATIHMTLSCNKNITKKTILPHYWIIHSYACKNVKGRVCWCKCP